MQDYLMHSGSGWIDEDAWQFIKESVPISCVDFVPVRRDPGGRIEKVGLILRDTPFDARQLWCHLGGRVNIGESLVHALQRHARSTLTGEAVRFPDDPRPLAVMEWFPSKMNPDRDQNEPWWRYGEDPRKHAISLCFTVDAESEVDVQISGEGIRFQWFTRDELPRVAVWPGSDKLVQKLLNADDLSSAEVTANQRASYAALSARSLNHNSLVWQTPALVLAAEAFLLTIALNPFATTFSRVVAAGLNAMLSMLCYQLMTKHREMQVLDREALVRIESNLGMGPHHDRIDVRRLSWVGRRRSGELWRAGFLVLAGVSVLILALAIAQVGLHA